MVWGVVCIFGLWCVVLFVVLFEVRGRVAGFNYVGVGGDFVLRGEGLVFWSVFYIFGLLVLGVLFEIEGFWGGVVEFCFFGVVKVMFWGVLVFGWWCYSFEGVMM